MRLLTYISKENSLYLRGMVAIMMVVLHTFNTAVLKDCYNLCYIKGTPLWAIISSGCNPVAIYLFLAGYGQYLLYKRYGKTGGGKSGNK